MIVTKTGFNALTETDPTNMAFSSDYNTLKYSTTGTDTLSIDTDIYQGSTSSSIAHGLGYIPYVEVYVSVDGGNYQYCPFWASGASLFYSASYIIDDTNLILYAQATGGVAVIQKDFDFKYFIFKNKLGL